jgi:uncharacterized protein DUF4019
MAVADRAALSWFALADSGDYGQSWDQAAVVFQASISKSTWVGALVNARQPWGRVMSRKVKTAWHVTISDIAKATGANRNTIKDHVMALVDKAHLVRHGAGTWNLVHPVLTPAKFRTNRSANASG